MIYKIYIDVYLFYNFLLDYLALYGIERLLQKKVSLFRKLLGCFLSSICSAILLITITNYGVYLFFHHVIINTGFLYFVFRERNIHCFIKDLCLSYGVMFVVSGFIEWINEMFFCNGNFLILVVGSFLIFYVVIGAAGRELKKKHCLFELCLQKEDISVSLIGLYDTGNHLMDPFVHRPVHIIDEKIIENHFSNEKKFKRMIPFESLGEERGLIYVITLDSMKIVNQKEGKELCPVDLALGSHALFANKDYQVILNHVIL